MKESNQIKKAIGFIDYTPNNQSYGNLRKMLIILLQQVFCGVSFQSLIWAVHHEK